MKQTDIARIVQDMRERSAENGNADLSMAEICAEIAETRHADEKSE